MTFLEGCRRFFYAVTPKETSFANVSNVPDYVNEVPVNLTINSLQFQKFSHIYRICRCCTREGKDATPAEKKRYWEWWAKWLERARWMSTVHVLFGCFDTFDLELVCLSIFFDHFITPKINYTAINYSFKIYYNLMSSSFDFEHW